MGAFENLIGDRGLPAATSSPIVNPNLPRLTRAYTNKFDRVYPQLADIGADPTTLAALQDLDAQRYLRGQQPMSSPRMENGQLIPGETVEALRAATPTPEEPFGRSVQPEQRKTAITDLPGNFRSDVATLFRAIPKLPIQMAKTVVELPQAPVKLSEALGTGDMRKVAEVPGINLIPGAYTLGNIAEGDFASIIEHPLFTALDVAPYAKGKFFRAPASMLDDAGRLANPSLYDRLFPKTTRVGLEEAERATGLTRRVARTGDPTPRVSAWDLAKNATNGRYARASDAMKFAVRGSRAGRFYQQALGQGTRDLMIQTNQLTRLVDEIMDPESPFWGLSDYERNTVYKGVFNVDEPAIKQLAEFNTKYNDEFGKQMYGSAEDWAVRRTELSSLMERSPDELAKLPAHEQQFVSDYKATARGIVEPYISRDVNDPRPFMEVDLDLPNGGTTKELVPFAQGKKLLKARYARDMGREMADIHALVKDPTTSTLTAEEVAARMNASPLLNDPATPRDVQSLVMEGYTHALMARGVDARAELARIVQGRNGGGKPSLAQDAADLSASLPYPPLTLDDLRDAAQPQFVSTTGRTIRQNQTNVLRPLIVALQSERVPLIRKEYQRLVERNLLDDPTVPPPLRDLPPQQVVQSLDQIQRTQKFLNHDILKRAAKPSFQRFLDNQYARMNRSTVPARWTPKVGEAVRARMAEWAGELTRTSNLNPELAADIVMRVNRGEYAPLQQAIDAGGVVGEVAPKGGWQALHHEARREMADSWRQLAENGLDPVYVHHVGLGKAGKVHFPGVNVSGKAPTHWRERALDFSPAEGDVALALNHQAMEVLIKKAEDHLNDLITKGSDVEGWAPVAKSYADLTELFRPVIERYAQRHNVPWETAAENVVKKSWVRWEAPKYRNFGTAESPLYPRGASGQPGARTSAARAADLYVPRNIMDALGKLQERPKAIAVWDPVMNVFRTSTLLLSPRWQVYNVLGNMLNVTSQEGLGWVKHLPEAWKAANEVRRGQSPSVLPSIGEMPGSLRLSLGQAPVEQIQYLEWGKPGVKQLHTWVDKVAGEGASTRAMNNWGKPIGKGLSKVTDFSVRLNAMVDDTARIAGYLSAWERWRGKTPHPFAPQLSKYLEEQGMNFRSWDDAVRMQAERDMRRWAYNWDQMTPWERSTARWVFPFYGFFSHMIRYAYQYTMEHPFRMAVTAAFARSELEDWGTGLPAYLHNLFIYGKPDEKGNRAALNFGGWNPFADTANLLTPTGWMSQVNPILSTVAEQFGIDPRTGEASLYPQARFNEQTGRLELAKRGVAQSFIENVIPQTQAISNLTGMNPDFNQLATSNPDAARRLIATSVGLPVLRRQVNTIQEVAKAEMARRNASRSAMSEALRTGSTRPVRSYPKLVEQVSILQEQARMNPEKYADYQPQYTAPGVFDLLTKSIQTVAGAA